MGKKDRNQGKRESKQLRRERERRKKKRLPIIFGSVVACVIILIGAVVLSNMYDETKQEQKALYQDEISVSEMESKVSSQDDFFAYFYQPSCEHCKVVSPMLIPMAKQMNEALFPVNIYGKNSTWEKYQVEGTPALIHFKEGKEVGRLVGEQSKTTFEEFLKK
ncbi:thioredoxin family protein [Tumebacillus lipolyticus]|uniref:Thioredoxin family protein n=1 Tax=Tumebacillus lipolyticus TaxID=1280370 RepID=A0ABW5A1U9_9BACL